MMKFNRVWVGFIVALVASGAGCSRKSAESQEGRLLICDPFNKQTQTAQNGIIGSIWDLDQPTTDAPGATVGSVQAAGRLLDATIVLGKIDLPTILFDDGFTAEDGRVIRLAGGKALTDYFSLRLEGQLQLNGLQPGIYQLGIIADDGAILQADTGSGLAPIASGDGVHMTQFDAATVGVAFTDDTTKIPFRLDYFQGPAVHMALSLIWRRVGDVGDTIDFGALNADLAANFLMGPGHADNATFWTPGTSASSSVPTGFATVQAAGFDFVPAGSFLLPAAVAKNPCVAQ